MKHLYLLRHAKSSWDDPSLNDYERPLSKRGKNNCNKIETFLSQKTLTNDFTTHVFTSFFARIIKKIFYAHIKKKEHHDIIVSVMI